MSITFPASPSVSQTAAVNGRTYSWDGYAWTLVANVAGHSASHASGGADAITLASSQITGLPTAGTGSANYCAGNDARLSDSRTPTSHVHGNLTNAGAIGSTTGQIVVTSASGVLTTAATISASTQVSGLATVATSGSASDLSGTLADARLSSTVITALTNARTPTSHADSHAVGGSDALSITTAQLADPFTYDCGAYSAIVPAAPTGLSGTPGVGSVALSWTAPSNTGGVSLTDYVVQYSTDQTNWTTFSDGTSTTPSATVTGLTGGTNYYFRVAAVNSVGTGAYVTSTAIAPTSSKLTVARGNGSPSTFTGLGTAASPYTRAARVMNNNADGLMASGSGHTSGTYTFTATASGTAYVTCTFYDDNLDNNDGYIRKNGTAQGGAIPGDTTVTARSFSVVSGDVITFWSDSYLTSFSNVSVYAV